MTSPFASVTFEMASTRKVFVEERRMKISNFSRIYFSDFLHLTMLRSLLSWKTRVWAFFSDETSSGVMRFKDFFLSSSKSSELHIAGDTFEGWWTSKFRNLDTAIVGSSKDILGFN